MARKLTAEFLGTLILLVAVVGSSIMGDRLDNGQVGLMLLANAIATGCTLYLLITVFGPISGAHFNPAVTLTMALARLISVREAAAFVGAQVFGGVLGVCLAHLMFDLPILMISTTDRATSGTFLSDAVATFGLVLIIFGGLRFATGQVAALVATYITSAYWFTQSTSFANPAVTIARMFTDAVSGIAPSSAVVFVPLQLCAAIAAYLLACWLFTRDEN